MSEYERLRLENIRRNMELLKKLGLDNREMNHFGVNGEPKKHPKKRDYASLVGSRSSGRIKERGKVNYNEHQKIRTIMEIQSRSRPIRTSPRVTRSRSSLDNGAHITDGNNGGDIVDIELAGKRYKKEMYLPKHIEALGSCNTVWPHVNFEKTYDQVNGTTCHQCRQKTIDKKTWCTTCHSGRGVLCGTCLQNRYGENLDEVLEKDEWTCPVCRDICNCSICRAHKGYPPTGVMVHEAQAAGYLSVAHYLVHTFQKKEGDEDEEEEENGHIEVDSEGHNNSNGHQKHNSEKMILTVESGEESSVEVIISKEPPQNGHDRVKPGKEEVDDDSLEQYQYEDQYLQEEQQHLQGIKSTTSRLNPGTLVACRAPEDSDDNFWIAMVESKPKSKSRPKKKKRKKDPSKESVLVRWFEKADDKGHYYLSDSLDSIPRGSIFYHSFQLDYDKKTDLYLLREDLAKYDE